MEEAPKTPEEAKPKLTPEERHIMYQRGGTTSGFVRRDEAKKDESGQYIFSEEGVERARKEMEEELASRPPKSPEATPTTVEAPKEPSLDERLNKLKEEASIEQFVPADHYPERRTPAKFEKKPWFWSAFKERLKGLATFGWWEVHQAEKFRSGKKKIGKEIKGMSSIIYATSNLSFEEAYEEAYKTQSALAEEGKPGGKGAEAKDYEKISHAISAEKIARNKIYVEYIVGNARKTLEDRLKKYRDSSGKQIILDKNKIGNMADALRRKLLSLENGVVKADAKEFSKIIKDNLDPKYWKRYIYGGLEAALGISGWWWLWTKSGFLGGAEAAKAAVGSAETGEIPMDKHIWGTVKQYLMQNGVPDPTNQQIMEGAKIIAEDNGIGVKIWGIQGTPLDTQMAQGYLLKFGTLVKKLAWIKTLA